MVFQSLVRSMLATAMRSRVLVTLYGPRGAVYTYPGLSGGGPPWFPPPSNPLIPAGYTLHPYPARPRRYSRMNTVDTLIPSAVQFQWITPISPTFLTLRHPPLLSQESWPILKLPSAPRQHLYPRKKNLSLMNNNQRLKFPFSSLPI